MFKKNLYIPQKKHKQILSAPRIHVYDVVAWASLSLDAKVAVFPLSDVSAVVPLKPWMEAIELTLMDLKQVHLLCIYVNKYLYRKR